MFRVGKPRLRVSLGANTVITAGPHALPLNVVEIDDVSGYSPLAFNYTVDRAGFYLLGVKVRRQNTATTGVLQVDTRVNGVSLELAAFLSNAGTVQVRDSTLLELDAGDVVDWQVTGHLTLSSTLLAVGTNAWLTRVGPVRWV